MNTQWLFTKDWYANMPTRTREVVVRNRAQCRKCGDIIESLHGHDFKWCSCGSIAVDGGHRYLRRAAKASLEDIIELSETYEETYESDW